MVQTDVRRRRWLAEIVRLSGVFGDDATRLEQELTAEIAQEGPSAILDHLRTCGTIPERYGHDSSEEKLYSKYTDVVLAVAFRAIGLTSLVLTERGDAADVEVVGDKLNFVADAKAFRLSRTAKNQKDFKIEAMHGWKRGRPHAIVVCPSYQLPARSSQIYYQSINRDVCLLSYSHLAALVELAGKRSSQEAQASLVAVLGGFEALHPSKDAVSYWATLNGTFLASSPHLKPLWTAEKMALEQALLLAKEEGLVFLSEERVRIMRLSRDEAIAQIVADRNLDGRESTIRAVRDNNILSYGR